MMNNITIIVEAVITLIAAVITVFVIPSMKKNMTTTDMTNLMAWVKIGVAAAEQLFDAYDGEKKLQYVISFIESKGYKIDVASLRNMIESEVLKLHKQITE